MESCLLKAVCMGKRTRRGHFILAGIGDVRSNFGYEKDIEKSVTSVNCAVLSL